MTIKHLPECQMQTQSVESPVTMAEEESCPPTPSSTVDHDDALISPNNHSPSAPEKVPFRDGTIAFAVDISGSTQGPTIQAERSFISRVSSHLSLDARPKARILPWDNIAMPLLPLESISSLQSRGGTDPRVLLQSPHHRSAIASSSLWFLMTDGLISPQVRASFAAQLAQARLHGTSCVTIIFGDPASAFGGYGGCDISVGVGVYAIVPNCAFLFCNTRNGEVRLLQSKGVFTDALLKGRKAPVFERGSMNWETLPLVDLSDFTNVMLPKSGQLLGEQDIVLQDAMVVNLEDMYSNKLQAEKVSQILANEDNIASIVMTAQTRGHAHVQQFQGWIQQQQMSVPAPVPVLTPAVKGFCGGQMGVSPSLSTSHNRQCASEEHSNFAQLQIQRLMRAKERQELINRVMARSTTTVTNATALNSTSWYSSNHNNITTVNGGVGNNRGGSKPGPELMDPASSLSCPPQPPPTPTPTQGSSLAAGRLQPGSEPGSEPGALAGLGRVAGLGPVPQVAQSGATSATTLQAEHEGTGNTGMQAKATMEIPEQKQNRVDEERYSGRNPKLVRRTTPGRLHLRANPISVHSRGTAPATFERHSNGG